MYISTKLLSVAIPAMKRQSENRSTPVAKIVKVFPKKDIRYTITRIGKRPTLSAKMPNINVPTTEPTKNMD